MRSDLVQSETPTSLYTGREPAGAAAEPGSAALPVVLWSSFGFALLQNICLAIIAVSGLRTAIGLSSLLLAGGIFPAVLRLHADAIRLPMMLFALFGALLNLAVLAHLRHLRLRPAARWRVVPVDARKRRVEHAQAAFALITLVMLIVESLLHHHLHGAW